MTGGNASDPGTVPAANSFDVVTLIGSSVPNPKIDQIKEFLFQEIYGFTNLRLESSQKQMEFSPSHRQMQQMFIERMINAQKHLF